MPRKPNFSRFLRDARIRRGLSVAEVAEQVGVVAPASTIGRWGGHPTGCEPDRIVQDTEAADPGDAGVGYWLNGTEPIHGDQVIQHAFD